MRKQTETKHLYTADGCIKAAGNIFQYHLTDHPSVDGQDLGNVRITFQDNGSGTAEIIQTDNYYPFGLRQSGEHYENTALLNKYLYNSLSRTSFGSKELQEQNEFYDYGFRQMDPALGRWFVVDPWAEKYYSESPYVYAGNNPVSFVDFLGLGYTYDFAGDYYYDEDDVDRKEVDWDVVYASFSGNDIGYYISGSGAQDLFAYMQNSYMNFTLVQAFGNSYIVASAGSLGNMQFSGNGGITFSNDQNAMPAVFSGETPPDSNINSYYSHETFLGENLSFGPPDRNISDSGGGGNHNIFDLVNALGSWLRKPQIGGVPMTADSDGLWAVKSKAENIGTSVNIELLLAVAGSINKGVKYSNGIPAYPGMKAYEGMDILYQQEALLQEMMKARIVDTGIQSIIVRRQHPFAPPPDTVTIRTFYWSNDSTSH